MKKAAFSSKWLDDSNGLVKDRSKNEMEQNETGTQNLAMPSNLAAGLLARVVKGVVSFLQNLLSPQTHREGVRPVQKAFRLRELLQTAAVGTIYGLLFASLSLAPLPFTNQTTHAHHLGASAGLHPEAPPKEELGQMWMMPCGAVWYKTPSAPFANDGIPGRMIVGLEKLINVSDTGYWAVASPVFPCEDAEEWEPV